MDPTPDPAQAGPGPLKRNAHGWLRVVVSAVVLSLAAVAALAATDGYQLKEFFTTVVGGLYKASPSTLTDGQYDTIRLDASGNVKVAAGTGASATQVQGAADDGATEVGSPVQVGGVDVNGKIQALLVGTDGSPQVGFASPVTLGDDLTIAVAPSVAAVVVAYDGSTYDRLPGNAESGFEVQGAVADGSAAGGNPVQVGGKDVNGNAQALLVGTDGSALVGFASPATLADNLAIASAPTVAAVVMGFDGTNYDRVTVGGGAEATALRVTMANDSTGVMSVDDNGAALTVDWAGTAPPIGAGLEGTALRVTVATDSTGVLSVDDNASSLTVDSAQLPAALGGGAEAGAMLVTVANNSTGVLSVDDNGAALTVDWAGTAPPIGAGLEATALRVTVATDSTGVVSVDDNGANLSVDWAGAAPPIGAGLEATALRVTLATDSTGVVSVDDNGASLTIDHAVLGAQADAAVTTDANGAMNQHLRGLVKLQVAASTDINTAITADVDAAVAASAGLRLKGFSARESAGTAAAATFQIVNGATGAAAGKVFVVELTANESRSEWFGPEGIDCASGISIDWIAGAVDVYLHYVDVE